MSRFLVIASVLLVARTAAADVAIAGDAGLAAPDAGRSERRFDGRVGMLIGGADTGDADGLSLGIHGQLGFRFDDVTLFGELDYYSVGDSPGEPDRRTGRTTRVGLTARYSLLHTEHHAGPIGGDWWVEAGVGYEHVQWNPGGVLRRPDLALGFGVELDGRPGWNTRTPRHAGGYLGFRTVLARAPETDAARPAVCGGPCSDPSGPAQVDVSLYFVVGLHWGRG